MTSREKCAYCRKSLGGQVTTVRSTSHTWRFHSDRRHCRRSARDTLAVYHADVAMPPESVNELRDSARYAALAGFDYIRWPWWIRWIPERHLDKLKHEVARAVGGMVERQLHDLQPIPKRKS